MLQRGRRSRAMCRQLRRLRSNWTRREGPIGSIAWCGWQTKLLRRRNGIGQFRGCGRQGGFAAFELLGEVIETGVNDGRDQEGEEQAKGLAPDDDDGDRAAFFSPGAVAEREGKHAGDKGEGGHQDRTQTVSVAL